jgi:TolA-binding protein
MSHTRGVVWSLPVLAALLLLAGCKDEEQANNNAARAETIELTAPSSARPEALAQAEKQIRAGQTEDAENGLRGWLNANPDSPYRAEGWYLLGQTLSARKDFVGAKECHEKAIKAPADRSLKALAMFSRADCNYALGDYQLAGRQYHWLEQFYRDVRAVPHDELLFKLGLSAKQAGFPEEADYWFNRVIELYATSRYADEARRMNTKLGPAKTGEPTFYSLEVASFSDEQKALEEAQTYRTKGYKNVEVRKAELLGSTYYCVSIGKFFNRNEAMRAKEDAEFAGISASIRPGYMSMPK